jgi:hypothetical protein
MCCTANFRSNIDNRPTAPVAIEGSDWRSSHAAGNLKARTRIVRLKFSTNTADDQPSCNDRLTPPASCGAVGGTDQNQECTQA